MRWLLLVLAVHLVPVPAQAQSVEEYRAVVARTAGVLADVPDDEAAQAGALAEARRLLETIDSVSVGGQPLSLANPPLRAAVSQEDLARARQHLEALLDALDRQQAARPTAPDAQARLAAILARPEFKAQEPGPLERLLQPLRDLWDRLWRPLLARLTLPGAGENSLVWIALAVLIVLGVAAVIGGAFGGQVVASARLAAGGRERGPTRRSTRAQAEALAAAGDYRAAVHELYLATLQHLDERGLLRFRPSLTNREHLQRGQPAPALAAPLGALVEGYDALWYSGAACTAAEWQRFVALADATWSAA